MPIGDEKKKKKKFGDQVNLIILVTKISGCMPFISPILSLTSLCGIEKTHMKCEFFKTEVVGILFLLI